MTESVTEAGPAVARAVSAARLEFAFNGLPLSLVVSLLLAGMAVVMLRGSGAGSLADLLCWFAALALINGLRYSHYRGYQLHMQRGDLDLATFDRYLLFGCLAAGLVWGAAALLFLPDRLEMQFFVAFVIAGVSSGAVSSLSVHPPAAYAFAIPCVLPLQFRFMLQGDRLHVVMGMMIGLYMVLVTFVARRGHLQLTRLVVSRLETESSQAALKSSELERQASDQRLRVAAEAGQIGVWEWNLVTNQIAWDERMYRMYCLEVVPGSSQYDMWRLRLHPDDLARAEGELAAAIATKQEFRNEFRIIWPNGEERFIKAAATISRDEQGKALMVTGINLDLTEVRRLERIKTEFVSVVSHELRTPLTSIRGSLGLVINDTAGRLPAAAKEMLRVADRNAERLNVLIDDLLDIEKLEAGKLRLDRRAQPLLPLIQQALEANVPYAAQRHVTFELSAQAPGVRASVDAKRIIQVLTNLLSNAVKFSPPGSCVYVSLLQSAPDRLRISVRDRGPGISPEFRARIFTKFSQCDASDARSVGGTGLGLAISKALVEQRDGRIDFEVLGEGGTLFFFDLPLAEAAGNLPERSAIVSQDVVVARTAAS